MGDFFDSISKRANERRNLSFEKQKTLLNSGILTPSMTNGSLDGSLTDEQIIEKNAMIEAEEQQAYNDAIALPVGMVEGAAGILGDVEILGQGIGGAWNADKGQKWDGFVDAMGKRQEEGTTFWNTLENQKRTDGWLEGTEFGDRLKDGSGGRLVGEILAPLPVPKGILQTGKIVGKAGMAVATHPMTRYAAETAKTETFNAINNIKTTGPLNRGVSMFTPPKQNMVIGENSTKFDMPSYNEFKKQIDVEAVMNSRKERNSLLPTKEEQKLWDLTAKKGNPTFIDVDGVIKQEIPTGAMNLKAPLKVKPAKILENESLGSYGLDKDLSIFKMSKAQERLGYDAYLQGDKIGINTTNTPDYLKPRWANDELSTKSHLADKNKIDTYLAHEGQHGVQHAEEASKWATGSDASSLFSEGLDRILREGHKANRLKKKQLSDMPTPNADKAIIKADAAQQMIDKDMLSTVNRSKNNTLARRNYFFDRGEIGARTTQGRVNLGKDAIAKDPYLNAMQAGLDKLDKNGNLLDKGGKPFSYNDLPDQDLLEQFKSGRMRDRAVIDQLNKDELGKMLDDEAIKASAQDYKSFVNDHMKKLMKKNGMRLGQDYPNLKKNGFGYEGTEGKMGHGFQIHFKVDGKSYHVGSGASTPRTDVRALDRTLTGLNKYFDKGSDTYMNADKSHIIVKGDGSGGRISGSMPNPDAKFFDDLSQDVIPKNRQNETTRLIKSPNGTEIEKSLGYRGDPMLDSDWFDQFISSQTPTKDAIKYGANGEEIVPPMNNVLDANGGITKQPSTGLNSEAMSNMNPMEVARGRGIQGYKEIKEELRTLYKEAQGDPAMQKQIRDQIVAVDKQMNMFDADVAKPRKSIYEESSGFNTEGDEILRHSNPEDPYSPNNSTSHHIDRDIRTAEADDSFFTGKGALPDNPNTISDIAIDAGGTPTAPVMAKAADKKLVKSIETSLGARSRRSPDEKINEILRNISDLESKPVPKQARLAQADKIAKDKILKYAYEAIESIQRNSYMGVDSLGTSLTRTPTNALDSIGKETAETYKPKVTKPRFDSAENYEFDQMLRSWDKEPVNVKTRQRYLNNLPKAKKGEDFGWKKKNDFFGELEQPRTSYSMPVNRRVNQDTGFSMGTDAEIQTAKDNYNKIRRKSRANKNITEIEKEEISQARKDLSLIQGKGSRENPKTRSDKGGVRGENKKLTKYVSKEADDYRAFRRDMRRKYDSLDQMSDTERLKFNKLIKAVNHKHKNVSPQSDIWKNNDHPHKGKTGRSFIKDYKKSIPQSNVIDGVRVNKKTSHPMGTDEEIIAAHKEYNVHNSIRARHNRFGTKMSEQELSDYAKAVNKYSHMSGKRGKFTPHQEGKGGKRPQLIYSRTPVGQTKADKVKIKNIYEKSRRLTQETGEIHNVDHIIPLTPIKFTTRDGRKVALKQGWHEPSNLKVIKASLNKSKGNRILPEQYEAILQRLNPQDKIDFQEWYNIKGFYD